MRSKLPMRIVSVQLPSETEKVERTKRMERVHSDREVELTSIEAEKDIEREKKNIADIIRERVAVDKTVAIGGRKD